MFDTLHEANFQLYAAKYYENPHCLDTAEWLDDLNRFKYLKRLFNKYVDNGELRERLILNHIRVIYNVWGTGELGPEPATRMLFLRLSGYEQYLKPFLVLLGYMPERVVGIGLDNKTIISTDIALDAGVVQALRAL